VRHDLQNEPVQQGEDPPGCRVRSAHDITWCSSPARIVRVSNCCHFALCHTSIGSAPVTISRTGYTGDLGFEVFVGADDALPVLDAILAAGGGRGLRPFGEEALLMARIEAGLVLIDVEFRSSRFAPRPR
jgi:glycine cleavage system aminomethyltransferase T